MLVKIFQAHQQYSQIKNKSDLITNNKPKNNSFHKINSILFYILILFIFPYTCNCATATVSSASSFVGIPTNYTITITNHLNPSIIRLQFSQWTPWQALPYSSSSQYYLNSGSFSNTLLSCRARFANTIMQCTMPTPIALIGPTIQIIITNINNPSSTKPYPITFILMYTSSPDSTISSTLTVNNTRNTDITLSNYNQTVSSISSTGWVLSFDYYFDYSTILSIQYNSTYILLNFVGLTGATVLGTTNVSNIITVRISNWSDTSRGLRIISAIAVINPNAAFTATASCSLYFLDSTNTSIIYRIQTFTTTFTVLPSVFTTITATNSLRLGLPLQSFVITTSTCPLPAINATTTNASYTDIIYNNTIWTNAVCTSTTANGSNYCRYNSTIFPKQISSFTQSVIQTTTTSITITLYTYFAPLANYYPLCSQLYPITLQPQQLLTTALFFDISRCTTTKIAGQNNTNTVLIIKVDSAAIGDIVKIYGVLGSMNGAWQKVVNTTIYSYTLTSSNLINSTHLTIPFSYNNPTYITTNQLTNLTISRIINTIQTTYAILISTATPIQLCQVTTPTVLQPTTLTFSNIVTYSLHSMLLKFKPKFNDYTNTDYIKIQYKYYENVFFLNNFAITSNIAAALNVNGIITNCMVTVVNNTVINIYNISQINNNAGIVQLNISGLVNPAGIYSVTNNTSYQIIVTTMYNTLIVQKQQTNFQYSIPNNQTAYSYAPIALPVSQTRKLPILSSLSTITFTISNINKPKYFSSMPQSTVLIQAPFSCVQTYANGSIRTNLIWQPFASSLSVTLNNCTIGFFISSTAVITITQSLTISNASYTSLSSYVAYKMQLECPDYCLYCTSSGYCTTCANSTYSPYIYLYAGSCYMTCPAKTYQPINTTTCSNCHQSCQTCDGLLFTDCTSCPQYYVIKPVQITNAQTSITTTENLCVSICGDNMTFNAILNKCQPCQIDCLYCIDVNYCYLCKNGASLVGDGTCDFLVCTQPCSKCSGSMTNCTACVNNMYLYEFQCYLQCPKNTYPSQSEQGLSICLTITTPTLYFPASICSIILIIIVCTCNVCIDRGMTADNQRRSINTLTYSSSILSYMQLFALFIMLAFTFNSSSKGLGIAGILIWVICNIIFGVYYWKFMKVDQKVIKIVQKMSSKSKCIYYFVVILSIVVTLRTYRVLYCGLFRGVAPYPVKKKINQQSKIKLRKGSQGRIANQDITIKIQQNQQTKQQQQNQQKKDTDNQKVKEKNQIQYQEKQKQQTKQNGKQKIKQKAKQTKQKDKQQDVNKSMPRKIPNNGKNTSMSNKTVIKSTPLQQQVIPQSQTQPIPQKKQPQKPKAKNAIQQQSQNSSMKSMNPDSPSHSKFQLKRPYIIYLTIGSVLGSILFLAAGINQIIKQVYIGMLFWGLDLLFVVIASILCVGFDMWAGIKKSYLLALEKGGQANQTMENLMLGEQTDEATQQKMLYNTKTTQKIGKSPLTKRKSFDNNEKEKKKPKKKYELPASVIPKKSPKNKSPVLSPQQKQLKQKQEKMKKLKSKYSDLYKRSKKSDEQQHDSSDDNDQIPDIKVFEDIQMFTNDEIDKQPEKKIKKIKGDPKRMTSMQNIRKSQNRSTLNVSSNQALNKGAKLSWKMDDIFLGFKQQQNNDQQDGKTLKYSHGKPIDKSQRQIYKFVQKQNNKKSDEQKNEKQIQKRQKKQAFSQKSQLQKDDVQILSPNRKNSPPKQQ